MTKAFPKGFLWGAAIAVDPAERTSGVVSQTTTRTSSEQAPSWSERLSPRPQLNTYANATTDQQRWRADLKLLHEMGYSAYRIAITWTRIFPHGDDDAPSQAGLDFYREIFEQCQAYGIEPIVTIAHHTAPTWLKTKYRGWRNRQVIALYLKYCQTIMLAYKDLVHYWLTFDQINADILTATGLTLTDQATLNASVTATQRQDYFQALHHQLLASASAVQMAHRIDNDNWVGCMVTGGLHLATPRVKDALTQQRAFSMANWFCGDVQIRGAYPYFAKRYLEDDHVHIHTERNDNATLKAGKVDFYAVSPAAFTTGTMIDQLATASWQQAAIELQVYLNEVYGRYELPIMIMGNGLTGSQQLNDDTHIAYLKMRIEALHATVDDGVDLIGYLPWDGPDLGLASPETVASQPVALSQKRYYWVRKVIASNGADLSTHSLAIK